MSNLKKEPNKYDNMLDDYLLRKMEERIKKVGIKGSWKYIETLEDFNMKLNNIELLINILADKSAKDIRTKIKDTLTGTEKTITEVGLALSEAAIKKAEMLTLHFAGYMNRPSGINDKIYFKCREAFIKKFTKNKKGLSKVFNSIVKILKENR